MRDQNVDFFFFQNVVWFFPMCHGKPGDSHESMVILVFLNQNSHTNIFWVPAGNSTPLSVLDKNTLGWL